MNATRRTPGRANDIRRGRLGAALVLALLLAGFAGVLLIAGCGGEEGDQGSVTSASTPSSTTSLPATSTTNGAASSTTTSATSADTMTVSLYFSKKERMMPVRRTVPKSQAAAAAAMRALLQGTSAEERQAGYVNSIPAGTTLLGVTVKNGIATVDLSKEFESGGGTLSMTSRLAQVVFTLTQFSGVEGVQFELEGKAIEVLGGEGIVIDRPSSRANFEELSPAVLIESPVFRQSVKSPLRVWGSANTFEAVFRLTLVDKDGVVLADQSVKATSGTGTRGTFDVTIPFSLSEPGQGKLTAVVISPQDGSRQVVSEVSLELTR